MRIADFFLAKCLAVDEERRITGTGDDPLFFSIDVDDRPPPELGRGLSPRKMESIQNDTAFILGVEEDQLARGDIRHVRGGRRTAERLPD